MLLLQCPYSVKTGILRKGAAIYAFSSSADGGNMDKQRLLTFKKQVEQRRQELLWLTERASREGRGLAKDGPQDLGDRSAVAVSRELVFRQISQNRQQLQLLDMVLLRIANGSFGQCRRCGAEIGSRRLRALPSAAYCIDCQRMAEEPSASLQYA